MEYIHPCRNGKETWDVCVRTLSGSMPYEFEVTARGSYFHLLVGRHAYGNYLCIPNRGIGTELSLLSDCFWNTSRLKAEYPQLSMPDAISIVNALAAIGKRIEL